MHTPTLIPFWGKYDLLNREGSLASTLLVVNERSSADNCVSKSLRQKWKQKKGFYWIG